MNTHLAATQAMYEMTEEELEKMRTAIVIKTYTGETRLDVCGVV